MDFYDLKFSLHGKEYIFSTGKLAKQADGAVTVQCGGTVVLVTAVAQKTPREGVDFLPLTVDVDEKMYAAGKIPGGFYRREGRPSEAATLTARLIDRPLRPTFPKGFNHETHIMATILSVDQINPPDVLALNGASLALIISGIPFSQPVAAVRVGRTAAGWLINPTYSELDESDLDLVVAGTKEAILMVEAGAKEVAEAEVLQALNVGHQAIKRLISFQEEFAAKTAKPRWEFVPVQIDPELEAKVRQLATAPIEQAIRNPDKLAREEALNAVKTDILNKLMVEMETVEGLEKTVKSLFTTIEKEIVRRLVVEENIRIDQRKKDEIRPLSIEVGVLPRTHGSGLFTRGQTQVLSVLTLGTAREEQQIDGLGVEESKRFMHHYNFPPFSTGETGRLTGPKRREIGHGALAERALLNVIPDEESFPYTIRIVSEVLESNGSTSMASVCGSTLALMDAGVPISAPVAGIAMGLVKEGDKVAVLTDIQGIEDALGDMDFKVAGTAKGITALQMDIKITGVSEQILTEALEQAKKARLFILEKMQEVISKPRPEISPYAPRIITLKVPVEKIREVIGPGGRIIQGIIAATGVTIDIEDDGSVFIASKDVTSGLEAKKMIESIIKEIEPGDIFIGRVTKTTAFGAFVELKPGKEGLVHISKLAKRRIRRVEDVVKEGDMLPVKVIEIDAQNRVSLTAIDVEPKTAAE